MWEQASVSLDLGGRVETGHFLSVFPFQGISTYIKLLGPQDRVRIQSMAKMTDSCHTTQRQESKLTIRDQLHLGGLLKVLPAI